MPPSPLVSNMNVQPPRLNPQQFGQQAAQQRGSNLTNFMAQHALRQAAVDSDRRRAGGN